jgi:class 3 adenylate cyclase
VGEVERVGSGIRGTAVFEAARIVAAAKSDEILVSETARALATAAGLAFEDRGPHELKGFAGTRLLFAYVGPGLTAG